MSDGPRATKQPDYIEPDVEPITLEHHIPVEEIEEEGKPIVLEPLKEGDYDPDEEPF